MSRLAFLPDSALVLQMCQRVRGHATPSLGRADGPRRSGFSTVTPAANTRPPTPDATRLANATSERVRPDSSRSAATRVDALRAEPGHAEPAIAPSRSPEPRVQNAKTLPPTRESLLSEIEQRLEGANSLDRRFSQMVQWLETQADAKAVFVTDADGLAMAEANVREGYMAAAGELGGVLKKLLHVLPDIETGTTNLQIKGGGNVHLMWCETRLGRFAVGVVLDRPLEPIWVQLIPAALKKVLDFNP
ncbi:MAG TPA: hypothetical protein VHM70_09980 [Polyangiaceae bacterium]|jgi:hypothetical protein|nr:hypothetical protein [Polyangiaceae bacterium]